MARRKAATQKIDTNLPKATIKTTAEDAVVKDSEVVLNLENEAKVSEDQSPKQVAKAVAEEAKAAATTQHSKQYYELLRMLEEYAERCSVRTIDKSEIMTRAKVLFSIVRFVAPSARNTDKVIARELCQLLYTKLIEGSGTIYSDDQLFKLTYTMPPSDSVKFETFWTVFLELVNKKLAGHRITFSNEAAREVIKNEGVMEFIIATRKKLESSSVSR